MAEVIVKEWGLQLETSTTALSWQTSPSHCVSTVTRSANAYQVNLTRQSMSVSVCIFACDVGVCAWHCTECPSFPPSCPPSLPLFLLPSLPFSHSPSPPSLPLSLPPSLSLPHSLPHSVCADFWWWWFKDYHLLLCCFSDVLSWLIIYELQGLCKRHCPLCKKNIGSYITYQAMSYTNSFIPTMHTVIINAYIPDL